MKKTVLLTGATGFVGKQLLKLLIHQGYHVYILVRSKLGRSPELRFQHLLDTADQEHVTVIAGDLSQPGAGLSTDDRAFLQERVEFVIHSAALVRFDHELADELHEVNVAGTRTMVELAKQIGARHFYHVSTAYTIGKQDMATEVLHPLDGPFHNPYEHTKCIAEHLVMAAADEQFKTAIFRPSVIIGDSKTGQADTSLTIYGFIKGIRVFSKKMMNALHNRSCRIEADPLATQNVVPVDYVCQALVTAVEQRVTHGIYHLTNPNPPTNQQIFSTILAKLSLRKNAIEIVKKLREDEMTPEEKLLNSLVATYKVYLYNSASFCDQNTRKLLQKNGMSRLELDEQKIDFIIGAYTNTTTSRDRQKVTL